LNEGADSGVLITPCPKQWVEKRSERMEDGGSKMNIIDSSEN